jgi:hypothetical protein
MIFFAFGVVSINAIGFLLRELDVYIQSSVGCVDDIKAVYTRLKNAYLTLWVVLLTNFILFISFGSNIYLLRRSSYMILVIHIIISPTLLVLILTVARSSQSNSKIYINSYKTNDSKTNDSKKTSPHFSQLKELASDISQQEDINGQNEYA